MQCLRVLMIHFELTLNSPSGTYVKYTPPGPMSVPRPVHVWGDRTVAGDVCLPPRWTCLSGALIGDDGAAGCCSRDCEM